MNVPILAYQTFGNRNNTPVVFLHGFLGSMRDLIPLAHLCSNYVFSIVVDLPSHGASPASRNPLLSLHQTLRLLTQTPPILLGYSMGGRIALAYQSLFVVKALIALSTHRGLSSYQERIERWRSDLKWSDQMTQLLPENFLALWYKQPIFSTLSSSQISSLIEQRKQLQADELSQFFLQFSLARQKKYSNFAIPHYFFHGSFDHRYQTEEVRSIEIPYSGHSVLIENFPGVYQEIAKIMKINISSKIH